MSNGNPTNWIIEGAGIEVTLTAAATSDIGAQTTPRVLISGTGVSITSFGTQPNRVRMVRYDGINTVTAAGNTRTTASGDKAIYSSDNSGVWSEFSYSLANPLQGSDGFTLRGTTYIKRTDGTQVGSITTQEALTSSAGTYTAGAGRMILGHGTDAGFDGAFKSVRAVAGSGLFTDEIQDNSSWSSTGTCARAGFDSACIVTGSMSPGHLFGYQNRVQFNGTGTCGEYSSFVSNPVSAVGSTITSMYDLHVATGTLLGTVTARVGLQIDSLAAGSYAIFCNNKCYLGGPVQFNGALNGITDITGSGELVIKDINITGTLSTFQAGGGLVNYYTGSGNAIVRGYSDAGGAAGTLNLSATGSNDLQITSAGALTAIKSLTLQNATAVPAGGTQDVGLMFSSTAHLGVFFGSGVPTLSAAQGSLYMRTDGSSTSTRIYVNTNGSTTWTAVTTAA